MQVVVRQHPFYFEVQSPLFFLLTVVGKKKEYKTGKKSKNFGVKGCNHNDLMMASLCCSTV